MENIVFWRAIVHWIQEHKTGSHDYMLNRQFDDGGGGNDDDGCVYTFFLFKFIHRGN